MPRKYAVMSGSKIVGVTSGKSKSQVNKVLAKEYKRQNKVRLAKIA